MKIDLKNEAIVEMYIFETNQQIEELEIILLEIEKHREFDIDSINKIFRIMHTIKGSSSMMMFEGIAKLSHTIETLFSLLRENIDICTNNSRVIELILESIDFIKEELVKINCGNTVDGDSSVLVTKTEEMISDLKKTGCVNNFKARIYFEENSEMENIRAFAIVHNLKSIAAVVSHIPEDIINDNDAAEYIKTNGFEINFRTDINYDDVKSILMQTIFLKKLELQQRKDENFHTNDKLEYNSQVNTMKLIENVSNKNIEEKPVNSMNHTGMISVNVNKLDMLLDLVGELVISGMMVIQNPDLKGYKFSSFKKAAALHGKIISELQDMSMSLRMIPISATFSKMGRILRDINKKLDKEIELKFLGEETEIDKNIVESISDPLMHLVRNAADHGIENKDERLQACKSEKATITLEAKNVGSEVWIIVKDNGKGLNREKIYQKALEKKIISKPLTEINDSEIYSLIFQPGFSTKDTITEFSGRGVGLDVVAKNIRSIGGNVSVDSKKGEGTSFIIKIPLTLAIIGGMIIKVGNSKYTIPTTGVIECFRPKNKDIITDPDGNEMIIIRDKCYPIVRLHKIFGINTVIEEFADGIFILAKCEKERYCIFADELMGEQQVVVKALPNYINKEIHGISGCTLLGDGSISLIVDLESMLI